MVEVVISSEVRTKSETEEKRKKRKVREEEEDEDDDEIEETQRRSVKKRNGGESGSSRNGLMARWEKLFPKMMVLRVLLVEADDSTRQIISALLRKCSYKVASVSDGLKAWEILKGRPHDIDLILTEVDLPSISGYALLTLIMEHEICKNIPVIMMSSQDSTSTVYKCMLRGAADYLVKPIRRNELRNLWQHVWRRQSSIPGANSPQDESVGQDKVEATSENNAASNHSSPDMACIQNNKEFIEKGSDAQSSSTKPDADAESVHLENMRDILQPLRGKLLPNDMRMQKHEARLDCGQKLVMHENEAEGSAVAASKDTNRVMVDEDAEPEIRRTNASITLGSCDNNHVPVRSSREAIDFMGMSASHHFSSDNAKSKFEFSPHLDLSLTRCHPSGFEIQNTEERFTLRQSNASAFTRYTSRPLQPVHSTLTNFSNQKELIADSERKFPIYANGCNSDTPGPLPSSGRSIISPANGQTRESEIIISHPQQRVFPIKVPVNGISFNNLCTSYGSIFSPTICNQSGASPIPSPNSGNRLEPNSIVNPFCQSSFNSNSENPYRQFGKTANDSTNRSQLKQDHKLDSLDDRGHISPTTDQSATSSLCNGGASHPNTGYGSTSGSNSNVDQVYIVRVAADGRNDEGVLHNANAQRSIQRDAALTKFRLKRKDRCYEKKVRYESRKKLAEQRPRVKGQFVRQVQTAPAETDG